MKTGKRTSEAIFNFVGPIGQKLKSTVKGILRGRLVVAERFIKVGKPRNVHKRKGFGKKE